MSIAINIIVLGGSKEELGHYRKTNTQIPSDICSREKQF
jgi:hypothetical protein